MPGSPDPGPQERPRPGELLEEIGEKKEEWEEEKGNLPGDAEEGQRRGPGDVNFTETRTQDEADSLGIRMANGHSVRMMMRLR